MRWIPEGTFLMGTEDFYPEEAPVQPVSVDGFWIDETAVTAAQFRRFVRETGYVRVAERVLEPEQYPDADPELLVPGSLVFRMTGGPVPLDDVRAHEDAVAYAAWAGKEPAANTWQGDFPWQNLNLDSYEGTSPVGSQRNHARADTSVGIEGGSALP